MTKIRFAKKAIAASVLAGSVLIAPAVATLANMSAVASAQPSDTNQTGPDYLSITGYRLGAPSEHEVSFYGGSHKHLWVEQQLYGRGVVQVPMVDTSVHQSR